MDEEEYLLSLWGTDLPMNHYKDVVQCGHCEGEGYWRSQHDNEVIDCGVCGGKGWRLVAPQNPATMQPE